MQLRHTWVLATVGAGLAMLSVPAAARPSAPQFIRFGDETQAPRGYWELCHSDSTLCRKLAGDAPANLAPATPETLPPDTPGGAFCPLFACLMPDPIPSEMAQAERDDVANALVLHVAPKPRRADLQRLTLAPVLAVPVTQRSAAAAPITSVAAVTTRPQPVMRPVMPIAISPLFRPLPSSRRAVPSASALSDERARDRLLAAINTRVNRQVHQQSDDRTYGQDDLWRPSGVGPRAVGDCEDLALEKRLELIDAGYPADRLFMAVVFRPSLGLHAVLVARTERGDRVLDSQVDFIEDWQRTGYAWLSVEQPGAPDHWFFSA